MGKRQRRDERARGDRKQPNENRSNWLVRVVAAEREEAKSCES